MENDPKRSGFGSQPSTPAPKQPEAPAPKRYRVTAENGLRHQGILWQAGSEIALSPQDAAQHEKSVKVVEKV